MPEEELHIHFHLYPYTNALSETTDERRKRLFEEGITNVKRNEFPQAIKHFEDCFEPQMPIEERTALHNLIGCCFMLQGKLEQAKGRFREAEMQARGKGDVEGLSATLYNLATISLIKGNLKNAKEIYQAILQLPDGLIPQEIKFLCKNIQGFVYLIEGNLERAVSDLKPTLENCRENGYKEGEALSSYFLGFAYLEQGNINGSLKSFKEALYVADLIEIGSLIIKVDALIGQGFAYRQKDLDEALEHFAKALTLAEIANYRLGEASANFGLGSVYSNKGNVSKAREYLEAALGLYKEIGNEQAIKGTQDTLDRLNSP